MLTDTLSLGRWILKEIACLFFFSYEIENENPLFLYNPIQNVGDDSDIGPNLSAANR